MLETSDIQTLPLDQAILVYLADPMVLVCIAINLFMIINLLRNPPNWQERVDRLKTRPWSVQEADAMIIAVIACILVGKTLVPALCDLGSIPPAQADIWLVAVQTFFFHLPVMGLIVVLLIRNKTITTGFLGYQMPDIRSALRRGTIYCLAALPAVGLASLVQNHFLSAAGYINEPQYVIELFTAPAPLRLKIYLAFVTIVTAPVAEEFIFRGLGITALAGRIGVNWSILLSSLAFAFIHFNLYSFIPLFTIATAFSLAYIYTGSLLVAAVMHSVFNALNIISLFS